MKQALHIYLFLYNYYMKKIYDIFNACKQNNLELIQEIYSEKYSELIPELLKISCSLGYFKIVEFFLKQDKIETIILNNLFIKTCQNSIYHTDSEDCNSKEIMKMLLNLGADPSYNNETSLQYLCQNGDIKAIEILIVEYKYNLSESLLNSLSQINKNDIDINYQNGIEYILKIVSSLNQKNYLDNKLNTKDTTSRKFKV